MSSRLASRIQTRRLSRIGASISSIAMAFARSGPAWLDGVEVAANTPRYPSINGVRGLINEEASANLLPYSQEFSNALWVKVGVTSTSVSDPWGGTTALEMDMATSGASFYKNTATAWGTGTFTGSIYLKGSTGTESVQIQLRQVSNSAVIATTTVTLTTSWVRYTVTGTGVSVSDVQLRVGRNNTLGAAQAAFAQVEQKAYATNYIPTGATAVTRNAETTTVSTAGLLEPSQGSVKIRAYVGPRQKGPTNPAGFCLFSAGTYGAANTIFMGHSGTAFYARIFGASGTVNQANWTGGVLTEGFHDFQMEWDASQVRLYVDGVLRASAAITNPMTAIPATAYIGSMVASSQWNDIIPSVTFWSEAKGGSSPSDFTAHVRFTNGQMEVLQGHPWGSLETNGMLFEREGE